MKLVMKTIRPLLMKKVRVTLTKRKYIEWWKVKEAILKNNLVEEGKRKGIDEIIRQIHKYKAMLSYCLKCKKIQKT